MVNESCSGGEKGGGGGTLQCVSVIYEQFERR